MYGLIVKLTMVPGKRDEMITLLKESAMQTRGCVSYVVAKDLINENVLWVTEVWDNTASTHMSPTLEKALAPQANAMVSAFHTVATTEPIWEL
jgi:quinol monooxygenase YgiN